MRSMEVVSPKELLHFQLINWGGTEAPNFILSEGGLFLPDVFLMFPYILFPQTVSILTSIKCKNLPDTPLPTGTVNRVVQGVIIHPLEK